MDDKAISTENVLLSSRLSVERSIFWLKVATAIAKQHILHITLERITESAIFLGTQLHIGTIIAHNTHCGIAQTLTRGGRNVTVNGKQDGRQNEAPQFVVALTVITIEANIPFSPSFTKLIPKSSILELIGYIILWTGLQWPALSSVA